MIGLNIFIFASLGELDASLILLLPLLPLLFDILIDLGEVSDIDANCIGDVDDLELFDDKL